MTSGRRPGFKVWIKVSRSDSLRSQMWFCHAITFTFPPSPPWFSRLNTWDERATETWGMRTSPLSRVRTTAIWHRQVLLLCRGVWGCRPPPSTPPPLFRTLSTSSSVSVSSLPPTTIVFPWWFTWFVTDYFMPGVDWLNDSSRPILMTKDVILCNNYNKQCVMDEDISGASHVSDVW